MLTTGFERLRRYYQSPGSFGGLSARLRGNVHVKMESKIDASNRSNETLCLIISAIAYSSLVPSVLWQRLALRDLYDWSKALDHPLIGPTREQSRLG